MSTARFLVFLVAVSAGPALAEPQIALPPTEGEPSPEGPKPLVNKPRALALPRESAIEVPLDQPPIAGADTAIGAYGEIVLNAPIENAHGPATQDCTDACVDVRRLVLYVGHNFTPKLRVYTELEVEHAVSSASDRGEVEVEQAFVDYLAWRWLNVRAGLVLMPTGIVNIYHEPPTFNGADRPETDTRIIPSTWREVGAGIFGAIGPVRYQAYVVTGFDALGFRADSGLREGHQEGQLARAHDWGVVGRVEYEPLTGIAVGGSAYFANSGQGRSAIGSVPVTLVEGDVRGRWKGIEGRAEFANVWIGDTTTLNQSLDATAMANQEPSPGPVSQKLRGGYVELGYDVLHPVHLRSGMTLVAFGRYERTDTQVDVVGQPKLVGQDHENIVFGLTLRPVAELALKVDWQNRSIDGDALGGRTRWNQIDAALAFMF